MITPTTEATTAQGASISRSAQNQLGKDAFLKLLITQLKSQDPMKPMDDREFIAQLAQMSALEQVQQISRTVESFAKAQVNFQAFSLIGRTVSWVDGESGQEASGRVDAVRITGDGPVLRIGEKEVRLEDVAGVS
ncbi:MAG: flagellar hook capping FlgD N-terminal domain-containing protein [Armatimonadota bacterium]